jgi:LmbE family N-acetylglucosaminyl deacetylase
MDDVGQTLALPIRFGYGFEPSARRPAEEVIVKRLGLLLTMVAMLLVGLAAPAAPAQPDSGDDSVKINLMGVWAHPDDDTSIIGPCGVWHELYDIRCGVIMHTRGEGGGNAVGLESGPDLGLRRENEDRAAHFRSGTVDIFNVDRVDFYYNTSAPLTEFFWGHDQTLGQTVRIIRETRPDVMVGFSPLGAGHGNHQYSGRMIWEGIRAAADPTMFPEQLTGPDALEPWLVKKTTSGGSTQGSGGTIGPNCTVGFTPGPTNNSAVHGVWTGYDSPYEWLPGNVQGMPAGTAKIWAQIAREGNRAYPTQSRMQEQAVVNPGCSRFGVAQSFVPFQPNSSPAAGNDDALFYGATIPDPGGMPLGSLLYLTFDEFFNVAGQPFDVTVHTRSGAGTLPAGSVVLTVPTGWTVTSAQAIGPITTDAESTATFTVTPAGDAADSRYKVAANLTTGDMTGYTDNQVEIIPAVEGRFQRWGNFAEFDQWAAANTFLVGRSGAVQKIGAGETISVPVVVHNWTTTVQSGEVSLDVPAGYSVDATSKPYSALAGGAEHTVTFQLTHTDPTAAGGTTDDVMITTSYSAPAGSASEELSLTVVPTTTIGAAPAAPTLDAVEGAGEYTGPALDISRRWEGQNCSPNGTDCGTGSFAKVNWHDDDLYLYVHVVDDLQSFPVTPEGCWAHWLADSVEILLDARGNSVDTSTTFKSGIFPFTDDPTGSAGNGVNGPCWERDADNHQGYSSGPLADTVEGGPNAPGMEVVTNAVLNAGRTYDGGAYDLEVKIPLDVLPAAVGPTSGAPTGDPASNDADPLFMGLNITPYDSDTQDHTGQTRLAWSPFGSQQSEPYRWGHAYVDGYVPPVGRPATPTEPIIPDSALQGVESPQTIYQSATNGVPISGLQPSRALQVSNVELGSAALEMDLQSNEAGTAHVYLWTGPHGNIPVFTSSCPDDQDGFNACSTSDGAPPPWGTDMSGRVLRHVRVDVATGTDDLSIPLDADAYETLRANGSALVSFESASGGARAWYFPLAESFSPPIENAPAVNTVNAGSTVVFRIDLGDQGLADLADGYPTLTPVVCGLQAPTSGAVEAQGHARTQEVFVWKTDSELQGSCGRIDFKLPDGPTHSAYLTFR